MEAMDRAEAEAARVVDLAGALKTLVSYAKWQINEGADHHPTLPSTIAQANAVLAATSAMTLTEEQARAKWLFIRQAMEDVIEYDDAWTADDIDNHENKIVEVILVALFGEIAETDALGKESRHD